jgi:hypothetical protein
MMHVDAIFRTFRKTEKLQDKIDTNPISHLSFLLLGRSVAYVFNDDAAAGEAIYRRIRWRMVAV